MGSAPSYFIAINRACHELFPVSYSSELNPDLLYKTIVSVKVFKDDVVILKQETVE